MQNDELVASQARRIAELEVELAAFEEADKAIYMQLYAIGAPLNDNVLGYTRAQLGPFFEISRWIRK